MHGTVVHQSSSCSRAPLARGVDRRLSGDCRQGHDNGIGPHDHPSLHAVQRRNHCGRRADREVGVRVLLGDLRGDAYRCFVGNNIHDPCFADQTSSAGYVLCPLYFPGAKVLRINLTKKLPSTQANGDPTRNAPWAVRTSGGAWCTVLSGGTGDIAGLRINYGCTGGGILLGTPHRGATWTIFYAANFNANQYRPITLESAWW
jgi:hypothetical protein